jgi:hypothetical protein
MFETFGIVFEALTVLCIPKGWATVLAVLVALNPVAISQSSTYYVDGHTGSLYASMLFSALRFLVTGVTADGLIALVVAFVGLSASKTSGNFMGSSSMWCS